LKKKRKQPRLAISVPFKAQRGQYGYGSVSLSPAVSLLLTMHDDELRNGFATILPFFFSSSSSSSSHLLLDQVSFLLSLYILYKIKIKSK
jgi:hypothetical protein